MADILATLSGQPDDMYTEMIKSNLDKRILIFNDEVDDSLIENYLMYIIKWNEEDRDIPTEKRKRILIVMNSQGGDCFIGFNAVDVIESSKTPIYALCLGMAASMAYHIYLCCHKRYAFKNSIFLMHDGEITLSNSGSKVRDTMKFFDEMETRAKEHIINHTKMDEEFYDKHYDQEYWMYADKAKELGIVDYIIGEDCELEDVF